MKRKTQQIRQFNEYKNVVIFPGTVERMIKNAEACMEEGNFEDALHYFQEAAYLDPQTDEFAYSYAIALYETKNYEEAKQYAIIALNNEAEDYFAVLELYVTLLMQVESYDEAKQIMRTVMEEGVVPEDHLKKFIYLQQLNERLAKRYAQQNASFSSPPFTFEAFFQSPILSQHQQLAALKGFTLERSIPLLVNIVEHPEIPPTTKTMALLLLKEVTYSEEVTVEKYHFHRTVIPSDLILPEAQVHNGQVLEAVAKQLEKDPSKLQFVQAAIEKFIITAYPFTWEGFDSEEIAQGYMTYIDCLMQNEAVPETDLLQLIQRVDQEADF